MKVAPPGGHICNWWKWRHLVATFVTDESGATWWPHLEQMHLIANQLWNIARGTTDPGNLNHFSDRNQFDGHLHWFQLWPAGGVTCISYKCGHQVAPLALPHCLWLPCWHHQLVLSCYLHQPESHQLSFNNVCLLERLGTHKSHQGYMGPIIICWQYPPFKVYGYFHQECWFVGQASCYYLASTAMY